MVAQHDPPAAGATPRASLVAPAVATRNRLARAAAVRPRLFDVRHRTTYRYAKPIERSTHLLRLVPRGDTTVVDAYLSPILKRYVAQVAADMPGVKLLFMQSSGGLTDAHAFGGKDAILSGPAGGLSLIHI